VGFVLLLFCVLCRRGVALNAAAGVTEEEWTAAVRLGHASAAAKAVLFDRKRHAGNPGTALLATAASGAAAAAAAAEAREQQQQQDVMLLDDEQQQQHGDYDEEVQLVKAVDAVTTTASRSTQAGQQLPLMQQQAEAGGRARAAGGRLSRETREVASEALAAVKAAAETFSVQKVKGSRVMKR
jgi:hypothetical protein